MQPGLGAGQEVAAGNLGEQHADLLAGHHRLRRLRDSQAGTGAGPGARQGDRGRLARHRRRAALEPDLGRDAEGARHRLGEIGQEAFRRIPDGGFEPAAVPRNATREGRTFRHPLLSSRSRRI
ncbi:MAG: hypothetical protein NZM27_11265 [Acetobacteraceae bacterium]|nr:hypothetical protein [Acetobacteraceae bacterium]MDW8397629.1 hypothetical protein [Acetobacteraceae bacterium]